jgi:DNA invertase Pin-like site-specific DNA recombinase
VQTPQRDQPFVGYRRTSTDDQLLGIDAQDETLNRIAAQRGAGYARVFTEHESGGNNERAELNRAIHHARRIGGILVVAKLDRLARDAEFLIHLHNSNVPIIFGDLPEVDGTPSGRMMVQMMAVFAEFERRRIGERTKEALAVLKAQGRRLGTPGNLKPEHRAKGRAVAIQRKIARAIAETTDVTPIAVEMRRRGCTLQQIADRLNLDGYVTRQGARWTTTPVLRVLRRAGA